MLLTRTESITMYGLGSKKSGSTHPTKATRRSARTDGDVSRHRVCRASGSATTPRTYRTQTYNNPLRHLRCLSATPSSSYHHTRSACTTFKSPPHPCNTSSDIATSPSSRKFTNHLKQQVLDEPKIRDLALHRTWLSYSLLDHANLPRTSCD